MLSESAARFDILPCPGLRDTSVDHSAVLWVAAPRVRKIWLIGGRIEPGMMALANDDDSHARQTLLRLGRWVHFGTSLLNGRKLCKTYNVVLPLGDSVTIYQDILWQCLIVLLLPEFQTTFEKDADVINHLLTASLDRERGREL